jgi:hypothetical protein
VRTLVSALAIGGALLLAACGGGGGSSGSGATTVAPADTGTSDAGRGNLNDPAVQQCLADKGITLPPRGAEQPSSPEGSRPTIGDATRQALQDCGVNFGRGRGGGFNDPAVQQCLADKGITLPQRGAEDTRPDDATRQAIQDCRAQATTTTTG